MVESAPACQNPTSERTSAPAGAPVRPTGVLLLSDDVLTPAARTINAIATAFRRHGIPAFTRDTSHFRWMYSELTGESEKRLADWDVVSSANLLGVTAFGHCDTVLGMDLSWLLPCEPFLDAPNIRSIRSIWYDDLRTACVQGTALHPRKRSFQEVIRNPKVSHAFYGIRQVEEARILGFDNAFLSALAAPAEYLLANHPVDPVNRHKLAFIGGPGGRTPPSKAAQALLSARAELRDFRLVSILELLGDPAVAAWTKDEPQVTPWLREAMERRVTDNRTPAIELLIRSGTGFPRALEYMEARGEILDAALIVKLVNRYDRPALVHRLYTRNLVDVFSAPWYWKDFGVEARPTVRFPDLARVYQSYPGHLNAGYSVREAVANEKLFEIAACARASFNVHDDEVAGHFEPGAEILTGKTFHEIEDQVRTLLPDTKRLLEIGQAARQRVCRHHTWDHRISAWFGIRINS